LQMRLSIALEKEKGSGLDKSEVKDWFSLFINPAEESINANMGDKIREFSQCNMDVIFTRADELKI